LSSWHPWEGKNDHLRNRDAETCPSSQSLEMEELGFEPVVVQPGLNLCCHLPLSPGLFGSILSWGICRVTDTFKLPKSLKALWTLETHYRAPRQRKQREEHAARSGKGWRSSRKPSPCAYLRRRLLLAPGLRGTMWERGTHLTDFSPWTTSMHRCHPVPGDSSSTYWCGITLAPHQEGLPPASEGLNSLVTGNKKDTNSEGYNDSKEHKQSLLF